MTNPSKKYADREPLDNEEIDAMLTKADKLDFEYFRKRVKALIAIAKKFGKRRSEIASLERLDMKVEKGQLYLTFTLRKKHKKGLFQYLNLLERKDPQALNKPLASLKEDWKLWTQTEEGYRVKEEKRTKSVSLTDKYAQLIVEYAEFLDRHFPEARYLFPSGMEIFGESYIVFNDAHLSGRQLLRLIKPLNPSAWLHLFRETKGKEIAEAEGRTIKAVYEVKDTLDLEREETAYRYIRRYAIQEMKSEA